MNNSQCTVPDAITACLALPATNEAQAIVLAWLQSHECDRDFWTHFPEKTARDICRWARKAKRCPYILGAPAWALLTLAAALAASVGIVRAIDLGGPLTITLGVVGLLAVLFGGILFGTEVLAEPWARFWNCEHADALLDFVSGMDQDDVKDLYLCVESSAAAVAYLDEIGKRRQYVANDFRIANKLTPGYVSLFGGL